MNFTEDADVLQAPGSYLSSRYQVIAKLCARLNYSHNSDDEEFHNYLFPILMKGDMQMKRWIWLLEILLILSGTLNCRADADRCGTCYEVFVYSFYDSNGDGIGDLKGLEQKLDYINDADAGTEDDLECDMIWLMPIFPSPTYHKYDVTDYQGIDPVYGSMEDFEALLADCHQRGIRLILDLPVNHTSSEHPWFLTTADYLRNLPEGQEPSAEECPYLDYYHFSRENENGYAPLEGTGWYYEAQFWAGMPDLNLDSQAVRDEIADLGSFWLKKGVDGFRLDAVTSYYTHDNQRSIEFLTWLNDTLKAFDPDCYLVGEAWTDPDTYARYYASGIDSMFDFEFAGQEGVIASTARGNRGASWYGEKLMAEEELFASYGEQVVNAPFYTNHDMSRSAGYYVRDDGSRVKLAQALNLLMPGNAFLYYGEELGMKGSGKDENKRSPMYWSEDPHAPGMCRGPEDMDEIKMKYPGLEEQKQDPYSIWHYVKKLIHLRNRYPAIAGGRTKLVPDLSDKNVCVMIREREDESPVLLILNTSDQDAVVDLGAAGICSGFNVLAETLCVSDEEIRMENRQIELPAFGIALLTETDQ